jgi:putative salt-induced outer membrane protein YdiY
MIRKIGVLILFFSLAIPVIAQDEPDKKPWKFRTELSYARTSGNTSVESFAGKLSGEITGDKNRHFAEMSLLRNKTGGVLSARKFYGKARIERSFTTVLFGYLEVDFLNDTFSGFDYRASAGAGFGLDILKEAPHTLKILAAIKYNMEDYAVSPDRTDEYGAANTAAKYSWKIRENVTFTCDVDYLVSVKDTQKYFANAALGLQVAISKILSLGISYTVNYQNLPPAEHIKRTDTAFLTSLIVDL